MEKIFKIESTCVSDSYREESLLAVRPAEKLKVVGNVVVRLNVFVVRWRDASKFGAARS